MFKVIPSTTFFARLRVRISFLYALLVISALAPSQGNAADKLVALYSAHAVPYAMPWVAEEMGLFKKYDLDFQFVYIPSSSTARNSPYVYWTTAGTKTVTYTVTDSKNQQSTDSVTVTVRFRTNPFCPM